ncbi:unnamed protein product [Caenorhabditis sp. 36 PRJEB53466]|nr:unnamed protein product [Caenorhabditis sp. 36 PRJEB53466]
MRQEHLTCIELILSNCPESIKKSSVLLDVANASKIFIEGGNALEETLLIKAIRGVLTNSVLSDRSKHWQDYLKDKPIDYFVNTFFNKSAEFMLCLLDNCPWSPNISDREAKILLKSTGFRLTVDREIVIDIDNKNFAIPYWLPYVMRRLCKDSIRQIEVRLEGPPDGFETMKNSRDELFELLRNTDYTSRGNHVYQPATTSSSYQGMGGTLCVSGNAKRLGRAAVFLIFRRVPSDSIRDVDDVTRNDFFVQC